MFRVFHFIKDTTFCSALTKMYFVGRGQRGLLFEGRRSCTFWAFRVGAYSKWVLIRRYVVNHINTVNCQEGLLEEVPNQFIDICCLSFFLAYYP